MESNDFKNLGSGKTSYGYQGAEASLLEYFANPITDPTQNRNGATGSIHVEAPEFTSLCPITGQPDFATIIIDYEPDKRCVESKSLKLYLTSFRMTGMFHEGCVVKILNDLVDLLDPLRLRVEGRFTPRGGIKFWPVAHYEKGKG